MEIPRLPESESGSQFNRSNSLDAMRLMFAILVIFSHSFSLVGKITEPMTLLTNGKYTFGSLAVDSFFILSGYLITKSYERSHSSFIFFAKRCLRIYPGFIVAVFFSAFVVGPILTNRSDYFSVFPYAGFIYRTLSLEGVVSLPPSQSAAIAEKLNEMFAPNQSQYAHQSYVINVFNGSLWTIRYEFWCYIAIFMMGVMGLVKRKGIVFLVFLLWLLLFFIGDIYNKDIIAWILLRLDHMAQATCGSLSLPYWFQKTIGFSMSWPRLGTCFFAGAVYYLYKDYFSVSIRLSLVVICLLICSLFVGWFHFAYPVLGGYLLLWIASVKIPPSLDFTKLGDLSYGVYLYGFPIKLLIMSTVGVLINTYLLFIIATMISLIMAFGSWHLIEKPALQLARRLDSDRAEKRTVS